MTISDRSTIYSKRNLSERKARWVRWRIHGGLVDFRAGYDEQVDAIDAFARRGTIEANTVASLLLMANNNLVDDLELKWVNGERVLCWLYAEAQRSAPFKLPSDLEPQDIKSAFIIALDEWPEDALLKRDWLRSYRKSWVELLEKDKYDWLEKKNKVQISWLWREIIRTGHPLPQSHPIDDLARYDACISFFDCLENQFEAKAIRDKLEKNWKHQVYIQNLDGRKQASFILPLTTISNLQEMSKLLKISQASLIDSLILKAYKEMKSATEH